MSNKIDGDWKSEGDLKLPPLPATIRERVVKLTSREG